MAEFNNNYATQCAVDAFSAFEYDYRTIPGKEYIESLDTATTFVEYTYDYARKSGYTGVGKEGASWIRSKSADSLPSAENKTI